MSSRVITHVPRSVLRHASTAAAAALLVAGVGLTGGAPAVAAHASAAPPQASAGNWLESQVTKGRIHNGQFDFDDWGLTIDTALALSAVGGHHKALNTMTAAIEHHYYKSYATFSGDKFAGSMAKSLVAAEVLGKRPGHFGGHDLRALVLGLVAPASEGFERGRVRDTGDTDFSNTFAQSYAVIGLARSGGTRPSVLSYLLKQQCDAGYFRLTEVAGETCDDSSSAADVDATALAVQAVVAASRHGLAVPAGVVHRAVTWLANVQRKNGSFRGGTSTPGPNTNSTGLAAQALNLVPGHKAAVAKAAAYVRSLQITAKGAHGPATKDVGAIAYNKAGLKNALKNGIQKVERDQFRRASAQAVFALAPKSLVTLKAS